ncbi:MAG: helix-turn-helix transcriptional regulator [Clostridia bacterium]|nr:helix-turn-helix transcriptional regulator [Clostridia bacterium]
MVKVNNKFSIRFKELREEKKLSQAQVGKELGYTQVCISRWESGERMPNANDIIAVAIFFNVSTDYLLGLTDL